MKRMGMCLLWLMIMIVVIATIATALDQLWQRIDATPANVARWRFDYLVNEAEARSYGNPCLRTTGPGCPRPLPLVPNYCPFPGQ